MKRFTIVLGLLIVVAAVVCVGGQRLMGRPESEPEAVVLDQEAAAAQGRVLKAKGQVVPVRWMTLSFQTGGRVAELAVQVGDVVQSGDALARLDTNALELEVQAARDDLTTQEAQLALTMEGATPAEITAAQAEYAAALAQYEKLKAGPTEEELIVSKADMEKAAIAVQKAQAEYDQVAWVPGVSALPQSAALQQASIDYERAKANYQILTTPPDEAQLKQAESEIADAKAQLESLKAGPSAAQIELAQSQVAQAQTALAQTQLRLEQATLIAHSSPITSATVTDIAVKEGEVVGAGVPLITLADLSEFQVETTDLDEWAAARVTLGQGVEVRVPALDNKVLPGRVVSLAPQATVLPTEDVVYKATIVLERQSPGLRWGMTVRVDWPIPKDM
ncbi:MAG: HlyD family efflux transporter periplasmic adaptor subunit [Anaerolineae bacterium]|nr:HlyD family efflux transporter periplasmic adaptor subunit [Anaerolineae bacterium]